MKEPLEHLDKKWYAVYVRSRHEKMTARQLESRKVSYWLPLIESRRKWSDRYARIAEPLFPGYIFVNISGEEYLKVLMCRGMVSFVGFDGTPYPIPPVEIEAVRTALDTDLKRDPYPYLTTGARVEVTRGPLKGYRGILIYKDRKHRLLLSIELIGKSVAVEIDAVNVTRI